MRTVKIMLATIAAAIAMGALAGSAHALVTVYVWATNVNLRYSQRTRACVEYPSVSNCETVFRRVSRQNIGVHCQKRGQPISAAGYYSEWWSYVSPIGNGPTTWISNVYVRGKAHLDGVPDCTF